MSEASAFAYTTALNHFLGDKAHRLQIGDASTVFWADCSDPDVAAEVDAWGVAILGARSVSGREEEGAERKIEDKLLQLRAGRPLADIEPRLVGAVRFCVLGLAPNAARLVVRFFWEGSFGALTERYARGCATWRSSRRRSGRSSRSMPRACAPRRRERTRTGGSPSTRAPSRRRPRANRCAPC